VAVLVKRLRLIVLLTVLVAVISLGYAYLSKLLPAGHPLNRLADYYTPKVEVILQDASASGGSLGSLLSSQGLGSIASLLGSSSGGAGQSAQLAQYLLDSDLIKDKIAAEFGFVERYKLSKNPKAAARGIVAGALKYKYNSGPGVLSITYQDTDKVFATEVVNRVVDILQQQFKTITLARVLDKRNDLETRLADAEKEMNVAKQAFIDFSVKYGIVDITQQASSLEQQVGDLAAQRTGKELERNNLLKSGRSKDDPLVVRLQNDIDELNRLLQEMRQGYKSYTPVAIPQNQLPQISTEYATLKFEVTIRQTIYTTLRQSLETVLLDEKDQTSLFQILQRAEVPELKAGPSRSKICVIATISAFFVAIFLAFVLEYVDRARRDPEESRKLADIRRMLRPRRG
jgi:tyrosine-protein kinase Etk/Wzc